MLDLKPRCGAALGMLVCWAVCGCGRPSGPPQVLSLPITGAVTLDGQPLSGAEVLFITPDPAAFSGRTKDDGVYQLEAVAGKKAVCKGPCKVTISHFVKPNGEALAEGELPANVAAAEGLPPKYSNLSATVLTAEVPEAGGRFDFKLTSK